ncbi:MAG: hypothetical protein AAFY34_00250 [Pseudomonadota bacterium]
MTRVIGNSGSPVECMDAPEAAVQSELMPGSVRVAFFGHDVYDAAIRRRASAFIAGGLSLDGFMMRRGAPAETEWSNTDLGETRDGLFSIAFSRSSKARGLRQIQGGYNRPISFTPAIWTCWPAHSWPSVTSDCKHP